MRYSDFRSRQAFSKEELLGLAHGTAVEDPPSDFLRLPAPPLLMVDRVIELTHDGSRGRIVGEQDLTVDEWFFQCHFRGDPVKPGCLGVDAIWQLLGLYIGVRGTHGTGRALGCKEIEFIGQIRPYNRLVRYEVDVRRYWALKESGAGVAIGTGKVLVDGEHIYTVTDAKVGMFAGIAYRDYPARSANSVGGLMERG